MNIIQPRVVSVDPGVSWVKYRCGSKRGKFPTHAVHVPPPSPSRAIQVDGRSYMVGEHALLYTTGVPTPLRDGRYHGSPTQAVHVCYALNELGATGRLDMLVLALPYSERNDQGLINQVCQTMRRLRWRASNGQAWVTC